MHHIFFGLGSNIGNRKELLRQAIQKINEQIGHVVSQSAFYATEPWGFISEHPFLNAVIYCESPLEPMQVLAESQRIEQQLGRTSKSVNSQYEDRTIDIDILFYDNVVLNTPNLTLPHPLLHLRPFVLTPLVEIAPTLVHPTLHLTISQLLEQQCR
ncbi:MAG: 2-amino-4-hydroxy-6-hydroxymethyldihydropteridine diphosphokinase [Bacteroidaceae bacterium]|nr:2-amino-4-hydroxy-6-hydroxymethyldihydropteridine diphosphokinase [Bacteroidaceae bacterium]MCF0186751.1 2-amino-4-hydroxy-6-hydroxymethyldihydropteridine diphosphokinase [Bacteroidaceae bacterium]